MLLWQSTKDDKHQWNFLIGSYFYQNTRFLIIREKNFTVIPCLLEEGSGTLLVRLYKDAGTPLNECSLSEF